MNNISQSKPNIAFCRRKNPRYIYHLTNQKNYDSIVKDGMLKMSKSDSFVEGVFAIDLINFLKRWKAALNGFQSLQINLLNQATSLPDECSAEDYEASRKLVVLRIPTDKLNKDNLSIRSQNRLFSLPQVTNLFGESNHRNLLTRLSMLRDSSLKTHLEGMTPAEEAPLFRRRKEAIEYIYRDNIPLEIIEKVGEPVPVRIRSSRGSNALLDILRSVFAGAPESKALK